MGKQIIILEKEDNPNEIAFKYLFWLDVPTARQPFYAFTGTASAYKDASQAELDALANGSIKEEIDTAVFSQTDSIGDIKNFLVNKFAEAQTRINDLNSWVYYGAYYDGSTWTNGGVA